MTHASHEEPPAPVSGCGEAAPMIREVCAAGSPEALGLAHGRLAGDAIRGLYRQRLARSGGARREAELLRQAERHIPLAQAHAPHLVEEIAGLGRGSELGFERAFYLQVASEFELGPGDGCSAMGSAATGEPFLAQNWDQPEEMRDLVRLVRLKPDRRPDLLMVGPAGAIGYMGVNGAGLGLVHTRLFPAERPAGLCGYVVTRRLLEFEGVPAALEWLGATAISSAATYVLGDAQGRLAIVELGGQGNRIKRAEVVEHTNHYVIDSASVADAAPDRAPDSFERMRRLQARFHPAGTEAAALEVMQDHGGFPLSICRHDGGDGITTVLSILIRLGRTEMLIANGSPCTTAYQRFAIGAGAGA